MEYYNYDYDKFFQAYETFINLGEKIVINAEDEYLKKLKINENAVKLYPSKDIKNITYILIDNQPHTRFELLDLGFFDVWGFGYHIAVDASLAIMAALNELDIETIRKNILNYKGIKKRFDIVQGNNDFVVIDDYAHHPTEIKATISALIEYDNIKKMSKKIVIWQPHKYSRTIDNLDGFKKCFEGCDELVILPIWTVAGEKKVEIDFAKEFARYNPIFAHSLQTIDGQIQLISDNKIVKTYTNGIVLGVGAGDITYQLRH